MHYAQACSQACTGIAISTVDLISFAACIFWDVQSVRKVLWEAVMNLSGYIVKPPPPPPPPPPTTIRHLPPTHFLLLQRTISSSPAGRGRSSGHSWLHSPVGLPIGSLDAIMHSTHFFFSFLLLSLFPPLFFSEPNAAMPLQLFLRVTASLFNNANEF